MQTIPLGQSARTATRLGFGCSSIMGVLDRRQSLNMLEAAVDAGITHFDTAPSYGFGQAESVLGEVLARHPGKLTVTTKYGIPPAKNQGVIAFARRLAGPLVQRVPSLKRRLAHVAAAAIPQDTKPAFTVHSARASLERSLSALRSHRVDVFLLHEATSSSLHDEALLGFLLESVHQGRIGAFGIGSEASKISTLIAERPAFCPTLQYEWSVLDPVIPQKSSFRIHHRSLTSHFSRLHATLTHNPVICRSWSDATGQDLARPACLANLMLKASLVANPKSVILFSSKNPDHIVNNVEVANDSSLDRPAQLLHALVRAHFNPSLKVAT